MRGLAALAATAQAGWEVISPGLASVIMDVTFTSPLEGYVPAGSNGVGAEILKTNTGGKNYSQCNGASGMMFLAGAATGNSMVASGLFSLVYTNNGGKLFNDSQQHGDVLAASQSASSADQSFFAVAGTGLLNGNGVSVSSDGGANFNFVNVTAFNTLARYVSTPSRTTWFVTGGSWPEQGREELVRELTGFRTTHRLSSRLALGGFRSDKKDMRTVVLPSVRAMEAGGNDDDAFNAWQAQIVKTSDGGKTFQSVYWDEGNFYFNQISCGSEQHCCAVGESDGGPEPGIRVYCSQNGGQTWDRTMFFPGTDMSVMAIEFVEGSSGAEVWAAGGQLAQEDFVGYFWHSTDGGQTWANETLSGVYGSDLSFPTSSTGFAAALTENSGSSVLRYTA